jgi:uracil-DNA glycosylase family 4
MGAHNELPLTIAERKHPLAECERCPLGRRGRYVPSKFPTHSDTSSRMAFIGEAPARHEIRAGEPFVGASGQLLNALLFEHGVDRDSVLLTNAASCHYPESMKKLPAEAIDACRPRLIAELEEAEVHTVVAMGNSATAPLLPKEQTKKGITKLRVGPPKMIALESSIPIELVATFHPAYCLRSHGMFPLMQSDLLKAFNKERIGSWYEPTYEVITEPRHAYRIMQEIIGLNRGHGVVVDTESGRDKDVSYGRDDGLFGRVLCIGLGPTDVSHEHHVYVFADSCFGVDSVVTDDYTAVNKRKMAELLVTCGVIAQNGKYDVGVLMSFLDHPTPFPLLFDTMLASYACYEVGGIHGLDYMGQELLGAPDWKNEVKEYITKEEGYGAIPRDILYRYNAYDVHATRLLRSYFGDLIRGKGLTDFFNWLCQTVSPMLTLVERNGMGWDHKRSREIEAELTEKIEYYEGQLPFNHNSPKQIHEWLEEHRVRMDSTDKDHIKAALELPDRKIPAVVKDTFRLVLEARGVSKLRGTYVTGPAEKATADGRVHTSYLIHGATTGRLSSRGPNLQNVPRIGPIKEQFVPEPRRLLIGLDYSQAELRVLTWLAKEETLRDIFLDPDQDLFVELCTQMIPGFLDMSKDEKQEVRTLIKTFAYGVSYGRTAEGIAHDPDFHMSVTDAQRQMDLFNAKIPKIKAFQEEIVGRIHRGEDLVNPFGRHRRFYLITPTNQRDVENEAKAYLPQSTASDIGLEAASRCTKEGIFLVNLVHDALYAEAAPDEVDEVIALMDRIMVTVGEEVTEGYVPFRTDAKVGKRWSDLS